MQRFLVVAVFTLGPANPTRAQTLERFWFEQPAMGTMFSLVLYAPDSSVARTAAAAAFARIEALEQQLSDYDPESEISRLSRTAGTGGWVPVGSDVWAVIARAQFWSVRTYGAFDVTVGPLTRLWRWSHRRDLPVDTMRLAMAFTSVGFDGMQLDSVSHRVKLDWPGMRLDVGGIAKGYAADEALAVLHAHGVTRAMVDAGGDLVLGEAPPAALGWRIDLPSLSRDGRPQREVRMIANGAIATSGDEFRFVESGGVRRSHLIDPRTGQSITVRRIVTVITRTGIDADALASALSVLGVHRGLAPIGEIVGTCARVLEEYDAGPSRWRSWDVCPAMPPVPITRVPQ